jgi:hypothetical protein
MSGTSTAFDTARASPAVAVIHESGVNASPVRGSIGTLDDASRPYRPSASPRADAVAGGVHQVEPPFVLHEPAVRVAQEPAGVVGAHPRELLAADGDAGAVEAHAHPRAGVVHLVEVGVPAFAADHDLRLLRDRARVRRVGRVLGPAVELPQVDAGRARGRGRLLFGRSLPPPQADEGGDRSRGEKRAGDQEAADVTDR